MRSDSATNTTYVREGTYSQKTPLVLTAVDSGHTFQAYGTEKPIVRGGTGVTKLVDIQETRDITIKGITFRDTVTYDNNDVSAAIVVDESSGIKLIQNTFLDVGRAVMLDGDSHHNTIDGNRVSRAASTGIDLTPESHENTVINNHLSDIGLLIHEGGAINLLETWEIALRTI